MPCRVKAVFPLSSTTTKHTHLVCKTSIALYIFAASQVSELSFVWHRILNRVCPYLCYIHFLKDHEVVLMKTHGKGIYGVIYAGHDVLIIFVKLLLVRLECKKEVNRPLQVFAVHCTLNYDTNIQISTRLALNCINVFYSFHNGWFSM